MSLREDAREIFRRALQAVEPAAAVKRQCSVRGHMLRAGDHSFDLRSYGRVRVIGAGKACAAMARAVEDLLGDHLVDGVGIARSSAQTPRISLLEGGHPLPDARSLRSTRRLLRFLEGGREDDLVIFLLSGGASAMLEALPKGVTLAYMRTLTNLLLRSGASIDEINTVRKSVSLVKGGRLLAAAAPANCLVLVLSDVIGNPLEHIGSGPMFPAAVDASEAPRVLRRYGLTAQVPPPLLRVMEKAKPPRLGQSAPHVVVGDNALLASSACEAAQHLGYQCQVHSTSVQGEASEAGAHWAALARGGTCVVGSGETTVTVRGRGVGGRNQEMALGFALQASGMKNVLLLCAASDGLDGPTDAAGAMADGDTAVRARDVGLDAAQVLGDNDSYHFFDALGDLVKTGPTGTNVNDLYLLLKR